MLIDGLELGTGSILLVAALYGGTMKLADLFDEHGLRWFRGDGLLFGLLWGVFGSLLLLADPILANGLLAQQLGYLVRLRLDYRNHAIAALMMVLTFLMTQQFDLSIFTFFFAGFTSLGLVRDYYGKKKEPRWLYYLNEPAWYYLLVPAGYGWATGTWLPFAVFGIYRLTYNIVKYGLYWSGSYVKL